MTSLNFAFSHLASSTGWRGIWTANLILLSLDHLSTGLLGVFAPQRAIQMYRALFGIQFSENPEIAAVLKPWGALAVFAAVATIFPIVDPLRYRGVLIALLVLLLLRIMIRFCARATASALFGLSSRRNAWHIALIALCASLIASEILLL
jgi:hypothetical protein